MEKMGMKMEGKGQLVDLQKNQSGMRWVWKYTYDKIEEARFHYVQKPLKLSLKT